MTAFRFIPLLIAVLPLILTGCEAADLLAGIEDWQPGRFIDLPQGRLYLPKDWKASAANSGGFGTTMTQELAQNPTLAGSVPVPVFISWGEKEGADHGKDAAAYLRKLGRPVETMTQPGGHLLLEEQAREMLARNRSVEKIPLRD